MKKSLTEFAYQRLRTMILSNELEVGHYYLEQSLADGIDVSRTPLREACIRLVQEGLVEIVPRRGIYIKPISIKELQEIYEVIAGLELQALRLIKHEHCHGEHWNSMALHVEGLNTAFHQNDKSLWLEHDTGFHNALIRLSGNDTLTKMTQQLLDKSQRIRLLTLKVRPIPEASTREHTAAFRALEEGHFDEAVTIHERHRLRSSKELIDLLQGITGLIESTDTTNA
ncbi:putative HTH-type transcriptional regulator in the TAR-I ttuE-ttuC'intergenic region [Vibrio nigripulchritudo SO65]|uniref:GntR family transcriptional regulator n=1 Tax=Vibrio nigripulchritudo TaxID=28173 RepID=UPI0003B209AE|nr:GntR family transcriptional regulator [Vibrio nigripulchritudo]CCN33610.1 putative HTH-type transcriptional regulator in the TAR-I ttuE-ttuC'intergenic region [Vibrio nigripulchritudo AM115]CCN44737.1 putative HTH-type transcriptional regulator in the TAR-I ttuE-ttuC'intergenic region [Vibrio nigripulchritudo FTn2]CCN62992.1 putative HTH-type transcriptional regulator in the TAR-I ttuE-ttuC'intergenic region [Vibrio nigripulchritudo POn4]CCN75132.1 putative HTH-type transcriptional regulator